MTSAGPLSATKPAAAGNGLRNAARANTTTLADCIQGWWRGGQPSNVVEEAGVLVRVFDATTPPRDGKHKEMLPWETCYPGTWCFKYHWAWPTSLISKRLPVTYRGAAGPGGFIVAPPPTNKLLCAAPVDMNSMGHMGPETKGCQQRLCVPPNGFDCSLPADQLKTCLQMQGVTQYNEVVVDAVQLQANLPHSLLGIFYMGDQQREHAQLIRQKFIDHFKLAPEQFALLQLGEEGFRDAEHGS